jgi:hypothetical protein
MKPTHPLLALVLFFGTLSTAHAGFKLVGRCAGSEGVYVRNGRVLNGVKRDIKPSLNAISQAAGKNLQIYSCFRSQARQNAILKSHGCAPFGRRNCSQSVARSSAHTYTIAADIQAITSNLRKQCQIIAQGRAVAGGGGVGTYPGGDGHFDLGRTRSWNRCAGVISNSNYRSPAAQRYRERKASSRSGAISQCHRTKHYPNCCGPVRRRHHLCTG